MRRQKQPTGLPPDPQEGDEESQHSKWEIIVTKLLNILPCNREFQILRQPASNAIRLLKHKLRNKSARAQKWKTLRIYCFHSVHIWIGATHMDRMVYHHRIL